MQCNCPCVSPNSRFLHIITHYVQKKEEVIRSALEMWIPKHKSWITRISADILNMKKRSVDDYLYDLAQPGFKWDEIGVFILCRMFHLHLAILMENTFWTSAVDNNLNNCKIFIAVTGHLTFSDTRGVDEVPPPCPKSPTPAPPPQPKVSKQ